MPIGPARLAASLALGLLVAGPALGQSGANQPARDARPGSSTSGHLPPTEMQRDPAAPPRTLDQPPAEIGTPRNAPPSTQPPPGHVVVPAPQTSPTAQRPEQSRSEGILGSGSDPIPSRPAQGPDATETGRDGGGRRQ